MSIIEAEFSEGWLGRTIAGVLDHLDAHPDVAALIDGEATP